MVEPEAHVPRRSMESSVHISVEVVSPVGTAGAGETVIVMFFEELRQVPF